MNDWKSKRIKRMENIEKTAFVKIKNEIAILKSTLWNHSVADQGHGTDPVKYHFTLIISIVKTAIGELRTISWKDLLTVLIYR